MRKSLYPQNQMSSKQIQENQGDSWKKKTSSSYNALFDVLSLRPSLVLVVLFLSATVFIFDKTADTQNFSIFRVLRIVGVLFLAGFPVAAGLSLYNLLKNKGS